MVSKRLFLIVGSILCIILLYSLPTSVVENDSELNQPEKVSSENNSGTIDASAFTNVTDHAIKLSTVDSIKAVKYRSTIIKGDKTKNNLIFADSLASLYSRYQLYDSATKYASVLANNSNDVNNWLSAGSVYYNAYVFSVDSSRAKQFGANAKLILEKVIQAQPENIDAKGMLGVIYVGTVNPMQGIFLLREVIEADETNELALFNLGIFSIQSGQYNKAVERFEALIEHHPENIEGQFWLGLAYKSAGQLDQAREHLNKVKAKTNNPEITVTIDDILKDL